MPLCKRCDKYELCDMQYVMCNIEYAQRNKWSWGWPIRRIWLALRANRHGAVVDSAMVNTLSSIALSPDRKIGVCLFVSGRI